MKSSYTDRGSAEEIGRIIEELDIDSRLSQYRGRLNDTQWRFVRDYTREETRALLELSLLIHQLLEAAQERRLASESVCQDLRHNQGMRSRNFGVADTHDEAFMAIALSEEGSGLIAELERIRQEGERKLPIAFPATTPPPVGKRATSRLD